MVTLGSRSESRRTRIWTCRWRLNRLIKIVLTRTWPLAMALVVFAVACGSDVRPTESPPTGIPASPTTGAPTTEATATPTAVPTERPPLPTVDVPAGHPAAVLALLPDSELYAYINLKTVSQRSDLMEHVEFQLSHFVSLDELPFAEELLVSVGADALLLSTPFRTYQWAIVLLGDFTRLSDALRTSAESGGGLSVSIIDTHREIDIYALVRTKSTGRQSEIYLTVLDPETLAASPDADSAREIIDRHIDGGGTTAGSGRHGGGLGSV